MARLKIKDPRFELISSIDKDFKEVQVIFEYKGEDQKYFIFIKEGKNINYIKEAKKIFAKDLKDGKVIKSFKHSLTKKNSWLIGSIGALGAATVVFITLFALISPISTNAEPGGGDEPSDYVAVTFNAGEDGAFECTDVPSYKYYVKKGTPFKEVFNDIKHRGAYKKGEDFLYWTMNGDRVDDDYCIEGEVQLDAKYAPTKDDCLTVTARSDNVLISFRGGRGIKISTDGINWDEPSDTSKPVFLEHTGDQIYFKRDLTISLSFESGLIESTSFLPHAVSGPIEAVMNGQTASLPNSAFQYAFYFDNGLVSAANLELGNVTLSENCFRGMFEKSPNFIAPPKLPATVLAPHCYERMFSFCTSLNTLPDLPAKTLTDYCYQSMFDACTSLTSVPDFPSDVVLAPYCYGAMFQQCNSLTKAPKLPVKELAEGCYSFMLANCSSLTSVPEFPNDVVLAPYCYQHMFGSCPSLENAPALPSTVLQPYCYDSMFSECYSLVEIPSLPATTLAEYCYNNMFSECDGIVDVPDLSYVSVLAPYCCANMFYDCSSLVEAPALPDVELKEGCFSGMFMECENLVIPPQMPTHQMVDMCYAMMFTQCRSLYVNTERRGTAFFTTGSGTYGCDDMFFFTSGGQTMPFLQSNTTYYYELV